MNDSKFDSLKRTIRSKIRLLCLVEYTAEGSQSCGKEIITIIKRMNNVPLNMEYSICSSYHIVRCSLYFGF